MPLPPAVLPQDALSWLRGRSVEELDAIEHEGRVLIPEQIRMRGPTGAERSIEVFVRVPSEKDRALARLDALRYVIELRTSEGAPRAPIVTIEQAREAIGADLFENIDTCALLARVIHERKPPHGRAYLLDLLYADFPPTVLLDLYARLDVYARAYSPRAEHISEEEFWTLVLELNRVRNLGPLAVIDGAAQNSFVLRMAKELSSYRTRKPSSPSIESSTREPSRPTT